jgi:hypothetical protein
MNRVEETLRTTLHGLVPEPPDGGDLACAARGRAREVRRARLATAGAAVAVAGVVAAVPLVVPRDAPRPPAAAAPGEGFRNWPRRGDLRDPVADTVAVAAWDAHLRDTGATRVGEPRVLYAGGGDRPVFVLHGLTAEAGDRLVVVTANADRYAVYADRPAPAPFAASVTVVLDPPEQEPVDTTQPCEPDPRYADDVASRILVLGDPDLAAARWHISGTVPAHCSDNRGAATEPTEVPLVDGAGLAPARLGRRGMVVFDLADPAAADGVATVSGPSAGDYRGVRTSDAVPTGSDPAVAGWPLRFDGSRAYTLGRAYEGQRIADRFDGCYVSWAGSLPDGTPVVLCGTRVGGRARVVTLAEDAAGRVRVYGDQPPALDLYPVLVDGHSGRWLVAVGAPDVRDVRLVDEGRTVPLTTRGGIWYTRLDTDPAPRTGVEFRGGSSRQPGPQGSPILDRDGDLASPESELVY